MVQEPFPLTRERLEEVFKTFPSPFIIFDEAGMRRNARRLNQALSILPGGSRNYFAYKACPVPANLEILAQEGMGADCSSVPELHLAEAVGLKGGDVMFTSNNTPAEAFREAYRLGATINLDDATFLDFLQESIGTLPELLFLRYNPGDAIKTREGNTIGNPKDAKYGLREDQLIEAYRIAKERGVKRFGLHTMVASNELDPELFGLIADHTIGILAKISMNLGIPFGEVDLGGGLGIAYKPEHKPLDPKVVAERFHAAYKKHIEGNGLPPVKVSMECGRYVTGPNAWLVSRVRHVMDKHKKFVGIDAPANALFRAAIYSSAYHHIRAIGKEHLPHNNVCDVVAGLCENVAFGRNRPLPNLERGDPIAIDNAGAHAHVMGNNYNAELRVPELLLRESGSVEMIRRGETEKDLFATFDFPGSRHAHLAR